MAEERLPGAVTSELMNRIEESAISAAREILSGRRIIDVEGPYGVALTTVEVGNDDRCREPGPEEASAVVSRALSVPMIYRRFVISKRRIAAFQETGQPLNLKVAEDAAQAVAAREEEFIYQGWTARVIAVPTDSPWRRSYTTACFAAMPVPICCRSSISSAFVRVASSKRPLQDAFWSLETWDPSSSVRTCKWVI